VANLRRASRRDRLLRFAGVVCILALAVAPPLLGRPGWDFVHVYRHDALAGTYGLHTWGPWPMYWLVMPFAALPITLGALLWNLAGALGFLYAIRRLGGHELLFAVSLPCFWTFTQGQIEGFIALGLGLSFAASPVLAGLGLVLLSLKPQFGLFAVLYVLLTRRDWRLLLVPALVYSVSVAYWGMWFDEWIASLLWRTTWNNDVIENLSLYPLSLLLLPLLFAPPDIGRWLLLQSVVMPYFPHYSYAPALTLKPSRSTHLILAVTWGVVLWDSVRPLQGRWLGWVMLVALLWEVRLWLKSRRGRDARPNLERSLRDNPS